MEFDNNRLFSLNNNLTSKEEDKGSSKEKEKRLSRHKEVLDSVLEVLEDEEQVENIMKSYKKEDESIEEYRVNGLTC